MNVSSAVVGYLDYMKDVILESFDILDTYVYDENLDFRGRASQFIAREGVFQKLEGEQPKDWVFIIWNRGSLVTNDTSHNRVMKISVGTVNKNLVDSESVMRMAKLDVEMKIVTNNIDIAERIEEWLHVLSGETVTFEADYGSELGVMKCSVDADTTTSFEKEDLAEVGSTMSIGLQATISFPVILGVRKANIIKHIHNRLWGSVRINSEGLSDDWIPGGKIPSGSL